MSSLTLDPKLCYEAIKFYDPQYDNEAVRQDTSQRVGVGIASHDHRYIKLRPGHMVTSVQYIDGGWCYGINISTGVVGLFPYTYIYPEDGSISIFRLLRHAAPCLFTVPKPLEILTDDTFHEYIDRYGSKYEHINEKLSSDATEGEATAKQVKEQFDKLRRANRAVKILLGILIGLALGVCTFFAMRFAIKLSHEDSIYISGVITLVLVIGLGFSTEFRAMVALCLPTLAMRSGQTALTGIIAGLIITGPMANMIENVVQLSSISSCAAKTSYEQTRMFEAEMRDAYEKLANGYVDVKNGGITETRSTRSLEMPESDVEYYRIPRRIKRYSSLSLAEAGVRRTFNDAFRDIDMDISNNVNLSAESSKTKEEIVNQVKQILEEDISVVKVVLRVMKVVLSFMFIFVIIGSCIFVKKYSQSDEFENHYLDEKFHTLDTMRGVQSKSQLLPLSWIEQNLVVDMRRLLPATHEIKETIFSFIKRFFESMVGMLVVLADYFLYELIKKAQKHGDIRLRYTQLVRINVQLTLPSGLSEEQQVINQYLDRFSMSSEVDNTTMFLDCIPDGSPPDHHMAAYIGVMYIVLLLTVILSSYFVRLRHKMAAYFFPRQHIMRVTNLYHKLQRERKKTKKSIFFRLRLPITSMTNTQKSHCSSLIDRLKNKFCTPCGYPKSRCSVCLIMKSDFLLSPMTSHPGDDKTCARHVICQICKEVYGFRLCPCISDGDMDIEYDTVVPTDFHVSSGPDDIYSAACCTQNHQYNITSDHTYVNTKEYLPANTRI